MMRSPVTPALAAAVFLSLAAPAAAQRVPTPEQRLERLERQTRQIQQRVFPQGQPANTAGFLDDPAATQTVVIAQSNRIDSLERQLAEMTRRSEESGNRVATLEAELSRLRGELDRRMRALESGSRAAPSGSASFSTPLPAAKPQAPSETPAPAKPAPAAATGASFVADGEAAYDEGFQLWQQKKYDQAITALRAMASSFPGHRRVSWANNLVGRALLDKGEPRAAAEALLANYRGNPKGERAPDSLFYLGQSLVALKQAGQACKAYSELEEVYGSSMRGELKSLLPGAKAKAGCD